MKLFSSERYTKPGKGVEKNEKPKAPFIRFFIVLWNKRWKIFAINLLYVLLNLVPAILAGTLFFLCTSFYQSYNGGSTFLSAVNDGSATETDIYYRVMLFFIIFITSVPLFTIGPTRAGFTYIFKSFYKEEPVFLWNDFITKSRSNRGLATKICIMNFVAVSLICLSFTATMVLTKPSYGMPWIFCFGEWLVVFLFAAIIFMMSLFEYPMMVIFNVNFKQLIKNSFILCSVSWFRCLVVLLLDAVLIAIPIAFLPVTNYLVYVLVLFFYLIFTPGLIAHINMFFIYPVLKKYLIDNEKADKSEKKEEKDEDVVRPMSRGGHFENGMWISDDAENNVENNDTENN